METLCIFKLQENKYFIHKVKNDDLKEIIEMIACDFLMNDWDKLHTPSFDFNKKNYIEKLNLEWTNKYKLISMKKMELITDNNIFNKKLLEYIKKYGFDNVRSDIFKDIELTKDYYKILYSIMSFKNKN